MADRLRPEHSDCIGIEPQRKNALGIFSDVAVANRPEVIVTAGQNVANGRIIQIFSDVSSDEPCGSHCNWSTNSAKEKSTRLYLDGLMHRPEHSDCVGIEPQRESHTRHFLGCRGANRPEVVVTAGQNGEKEESGHSPEGAAAM